MDKEVTDGDVTEKQKKIVRKVRKERPQGGRKEKSERANQKRKQREVSKELMRFSNLDMQAIPTGASNMTTSGKHKDTKQRKELNACKDYETLI